MRVLLLHPEDNIPSQGRWDLIVDFGRAPESTYQRWSKQKGCQVFSIYDFAREIDDLRLCRQSLQAGMGVLIDRHGIDWWDVLSLLLVPEFQQFILIERFAKHIDASCELYATRQFSLATALQHRLNCTLKILGGHFGAIRRHFQHYSCALSNLGAAQLSQVIQDKFDRYHHIRRRFAAKRKASSVPLILLPSAYVNVSRTAVRYAESLPEQMFLLVLARRNARLQSLPSNVLMASLDGYFAAPADAEPDLFAEWHSLRRKLAHDSWTFEVAERVGTLEKIEPNLRWALTVRDAWLNVLEPEHIVGCLCADDTNPYTRIPLLLAKLRGIPTIACHHGALDCWMALKSLASDFYLAKSEMERDYLIRRCDIAAEKIVVDAPREAAQAGSQLATAPSRIVFFTEPYEANGWRGEELYRDLLPRLYRLSETCGMKLVIKIHPFENIGAHCKRLRRILGQEARKIEVIVGPATSDLWQSTRFAITVESSIALECAERGVPVFLCAWLRDPSSGYVRQYAKFGVAHRLESPEEISNIPDLLKMPISPAAAPEISVDRRLLQSLFFADCCLPSAVNN